jgi:imidazolonepropionase-like amidohydrolase
MHEGPSDAVQCIRAARLVDGSSPTVASDVAVLVAGGKISAVGPAGEPSMDPRSGSIIDLGDLTLMPGLMDLHTHLTAWANQWRRPFDRGTRYAVQGAANLLAALRAGVTTIRDVGSFEDVSVVLRDAVEEGLIAGPRVLASRRAVTIPGALGAEKDTWHLGPSRGWMSEATGVDGMRRAVLSEIKASADWIKLYYERGDWTTEELAAAVTAAHSAEVPVACHANRPKAIKSALAAGVDTIEHGLEIDDEDLAYMAEHGIAWVPTLSIVANRCDAVVSDPSTAAAQPLYRKLLSLRDGHRDSFVRALDMGVAIGCGVDALPDEGGVPFASVPAELELMTRFGMPPVDAIRSATSGAAAILGLSDEVGTIEPGATADIIAVRGNPLDDIRALRDVVFVMRGGIVQHDARGALSTSSEGDPSTIRHESAIGVA